MSSSTRVIKTWRAYEPELEWEAVLTLAELSRLAYGDKQTRINVCQEMGFEATEPLDSFSKHGFIMTKDDYIVISFRGTDGAFDWLTNFHFTQKSDINRRKGIHKGFQSSYAKFRDKIRLHLADDKTKVWITGHSLGGAMAACCAYDLVSQGAQIEGLVTFGQPRIGNKKLAEFLDEKLGDRYLRLMNEDDPVPLLPPSIGGILPAYWHCGKRIKFFGNEIVTSEGVLPMALPAYEAAENSSDSTSVQPSLSADGCASISEEEFIDLIKSLSSQDDQTNDSQSDSTMTAVPTMSFGGGFFGVGDHYMEEYVKKINYQMLKH